MSRRVVVLVEAAQLRVMDATGAVAGVPWQRDRLTDAVDAVRARAGNASRVLLVLGGAHIEVAKPSWPPVSPALRRGMLHHEADRVFASAAPQATTLHGDLAFGANAELLTALRAAFSGSFTVDGIVALPVALAIASVGAGATGRVTWRFDAGDGAVGIAQLDGDTLADARIGPLDDAALRGARAIDDALLLSALATATIAPQDQLLDRAGEEVLASERQRAWWRAAALLLVGVGALAWSADRWRARVEENTTAQVAALEQVAAPALAAQQRLVTASDEQARIAEDGATSAHTPALLARLGALLPRDAWVQRLEWDGREWRMEGSAVDVASLVPRLAADSTLLDVRTLAPSTRFLDNGRARGSFTIGFRERSTARAGGTSASP